MFKPPVVQAASVLFAESHALPVLSVLGEIGDYRQELAEEERECVRNAVAKRQREFAAGRAFARLGLSALGLPPTAVTQSEQRAPSWPDGVVGSISHTRSRAWSVVARTEDLLGLGADLEFRNRVNPGLIGKLFTAPERALIGSDLEIATAMFCAKEAVYKATYPTGRRYIGFLEVETQLDLVSGTFSMRYLGDHPPNAIMEQGRGFVRVLEDHQLALFAVPAPGLMPQALAPRDEQ